MGFGCFVLEGVGRAQLFSFVFITVHKLVLRRGTCSKEIELLIDLPTGVLWLSPQS